MVSAHGCERAGGHICKGGLILIPLQTHLIANKAQGAPPPAMSLHLFRERGVGGAEVVDLARELCRALLQSHCLALLALDQVAWLERACGQHAQSLVSMLVQPGQATSESLTNPKHGEGLVNPPGQSLVNAPAAACSPVVLSSCSHSAFPA